MAVLLIRLAGPMQSWGTQSRFENRDTGLEPSKSGVIGLICSAMGIPRTQPVDHLSRLRMGVRVDREGTVQSDYHTAGGGRFCGRPYGVCMAEGRLREDAVLSHRQYLADADFLVGLEGDIELLRDVEVALAAPRWAIFLGRKSFVPGVPVRLRDGLLPEARLSEALEKSYPWPGLHAVPGKQWARPERLRLVVEDPSATSHEVRRDQPIGAAYLNRSFGLRHVNTLLVPLGEKVPIRGDWEVS